MVRLLQSSEKCDKRNAIEKYRETENARPTFSSVSCLISWDFCCFRLVKQWLIHIKFVRVDDRRSREQILPAETRELSLDETCNKTPKKLEVFIYLIFSLYCCRRFAKNEFFLSIIDYSHAQSLNDPNGI